MAHFKSKRYGCSCPDGTCDMNCRMYRIAAGKPSNADRIRSMTDEELAGEIAWLIVEAMKQLHPLAKWKASDEELIRGTADEMLNWLKQETNNDS